MKWLARPWFLDGSSANGVILDAVCFHDFGVVEIATVENEGGAHALFDFFEVRISEFWPFGADDEGFCSVETAIHVFTVFEGFMKIAEAFGSSHSLWIPSGNFCSFR